MAPASNDEILAKLAERMKETPEGDAWRVKVFRKRIGGSYPFPIHLATLDGANLDQLANAEMWLPVLAGGGPIFELEVFHASDVARYAGGGRLRFTVQGEERPVSRDVVKQSNWHGPTAIIYPLAQDPSVDPSPIFAAPQTPTGPAGVTLVGGSSPMPQQGFGGGFHPGFNQGAPPYSGPSAEVRSTLLELEAMKRDLAERQRREELAQVERKHRMEMLELEARYKTQAQAQAAAVPQKPVGEIVIGLVAAAAPLITALMESQKAARAEQQQSLAAIQQQNMVLMQKAMEKPSIDPIMQQMMDRMAKAIEDRPKPGEDMQPILEAFSRMTRMSTQSVAMAADLIARNTGQEEHPAMNIVREVRAAVEAVSEGIKASRIQPPQRSAVPPAGQQYAQAPSLPAPQPPTAPQTALGAVPEAQAAAQQPNRPATLLEQIEKRIRAHEDHTTVGAQLLDAIAAAEPSVAEGMYAAGGSIIDLFQMRLGSWLNADPKNGPYIMELAKYLTAEAEKRGMLAGPEESAQEAPAASPVAQA